MFQQAMQAIEHRDYLRARDLLTRLIKDHPNHADYWLWMSVVVETPRERIFCLKEVLRLDPKNLSARRGLSLLGAMPPDEKLAVPMRLQKRDWQSKMFPSSSADKLLLMPAWMQTSLLGAAALLVVVAVLAVVTILPARNQTSKGLQMPLFAAGAATQTIPPTSTPHPTGPTPTFSSPVPLWTLLEATYTPTPLYVNTPHPRAEAYRSALTAYQRQDWEGSRNMLQQVLTLEPESADIYFYIGETFRMEGQHSNALAAYKRALQINPYFAAAYLGRGRSVLAISPQTKWKDAKADMKTAIDMDPRLTEAYLELAHLLLSRNDPATALQYLNQAAEQAPDSPQVFYQRARVHLQLNNSAQALADAQRANQLDYTYLDVYRTLGQAALLEENIDLAIATLAMYTLYEPQDAQALAWLGEAYAQQNQITLSLAALDNAIKADGKQFDARLRRGLIYLEQQKPDLAEKDLRVAITLRPRSFDANIALGRACLILGKDSEAYMRFANAHGLATNIGEEGQVYYWRAQALEKINMLQAAIRDWEALLNLPSTDIPDAWRATARQRLDVLAPKSPTPTVPTQTPSRTPTRTRTPSPTKTSPLTRTPTIRIPPATPTPIATIALPNTPIPTITQLPTLAHDQSVTPAP
ncbi:MAG: tetratricopeptide repeat protein [Anaerolineae bacterium]|nr:tetratricopeptide repeat protein [Anaerolineae bacterium]